MADMSFKHEEFTGVDSDGNKVLFSSFRDWLNNSFSNIEKDITAIKNGFQIEFGSFQGDNSEDRTIELSFTPAIVVVTYMGNLFYSQRNYSGFCGGIATSGCLDGGAVYLTKDEEGNVKKGFCVRHGTSLTSYYLSNYKDRKYGYIAIGFDDATVNTTSDSAIV